MPTFCKWELGGGTGETPEASYSWGWSECDSGEQSAKYDVCVGADVGSCTPYWGADYWNDPEGWETATGLPFFRAPNSAFAAGTLGAGGGEEETWLPSLTLEDGGLIGGAILALWAFGWCLKAIRKQ